MAVGELTIMSYWYPYGKHLDPNNDFDVSSPSFMRWHRMTERQIAILKEEMDELHLVIWPQVPDVDGSPVNDKAYLELAAFGGDGYAACIPLAQMIAGQVIGFMGEDGDINLAALRRLRDDVDALISDLEGKRKIANTVANADAE